MKDILFIAHFTSLPNEEGNSRFLYLADRLIINNDISLELVTSNFSHKRKKHREKVVNKGYKITLIEEPRYKKNISLKRFYSHKIFSKNIKKYLKNRKKPDVIYCAVPSLDVAAEVAEYAKKNNVYFIIDIQDLWPQAFKMIFNIPFISNILFYPMEKKSIYIYESANDIVAVSETYAAKALKKASQRSFSVFLGTDLDSFDNLAKKNLVLDKPINEFWLAYVGTLGHSYDIKCVIDALKILKNKGVENIKFVVMGDGPLKNEFEEYANKNEVYSLFLGQLEYEKMVGILKSCDVAVNPITGNSAASIINKHGDYLAAGLPIINTQESKEFRELLKTYNAGINCNNNDPEDLSKRIHELYINISLREIMGINSRKLAVEKFDRRRTYQSIIDLLSED